MSDGARPERHEEYLRHILDALGKVARYTAGLDKPAFLADEKTQDAVVRNQLSHGYIEVNLDVVWDTVQQSVRELERHARRALAGSSKA